MNDAGTPPPLPALVEAMLFVGGAPLTATRAAEVVRGLTPEILAQTIDQLNKTYRAEARPYRIVQVDQGYELKLSGRYRGVIDRLQGAPREARLSPVALDVLALVAFRQPITKQDVDSLRGGESSGHLRQLVRLGLIAVHRQEEGNETVYHTTPRFLAFFGLRNLDDLPRTEDLQRI